MFIVIVYFVGIFLSLICGSYPFPPSFRLQKYVGNVTGYLNRCYILVKNDFSSVFLKESSIFAVRMPIYNKV